MKHGLPLILWVVFLSTWNVLVTGQVAISTMAFFAGLYLLSQLAGTALLGLTAIRFEAGHSLAMRLLCGYFFINSTLFALTLLTPFGMAVNAMAVAGLVLVCFGMMTAGLGPQRGNIAPSLPDILSLAIGLFAATIWCQDALEPFQRGPDVTVFPLWPDCFFHVRQISIFASANGPHTISDITMAGAPPHIYHFASYIIPSALSAFTPTTAYEAFASFQLPLGILLTVLAAYALAQSFGQWPALAGCAALALLPDAFQQGFGNRWLSYHWLQQVGPGGMYGVALMAVAWAFMFDACKNGKASSVLVGYLLALLTVTYKAHIFVANAYLVLVYPCLFMAKIKTRWRIAGFFVLSAIFVFALRMSQSYNNIPVFRLNGLGFKPYMTFVLGNFEPGGIGGFFSAALSGSLELNAHTLAYSILMLVACTFGVFGFVYFLLLPKLLNKLPPAVLAFPVVVAANYLIMATGLEYDSRKIGMPEEMLHRPFVWAYFVVCTWSAASIYYLFFGGRPPLSGAAKTMLALALLCSLCVPLAFSHRIQTMPRWGGDFSTFPSSPTCLVNAAEFIRRISAASATVQDSSQDVNAGSYISAIVLSSLSERQSFAINAGGMREAAGLGDRLAQLASFKQMTKLEDIVGFAVTNKVDWYVLRLGDAVLWPESFVGSPVFHCGDYRVYQFSNVRL